MCVGQWLVGVLFLRLIETRNVCCNQKHFKFMDGNPVGRWTRNDYVCASVAKSGLDFFSTAFIT